MNFILASKSPRRREILSNVGLLFEIVESDVDESTISKELPAHIYVQELAMLKSSDVASKYGKGNLVIGADTVVVSDDEIIGKPKDRDDAISMLKKFSGKVHKVVSGISVTNTDDLTTVTDYCSTDVYFSEISDEEILNYVDTYKPFDKAGAYGIQEYAGVFVEKIDGDFYNVVGLPLSKLYRLLKKEFDVII
ncbi:MAG: septum formation inhibitor Maf [Clostridia bacterium]|nr:septum formation inhibitor Maf [Clostridia bacterium]